MHRRPPGRLRAPPCPSPPGAQPTLLRRSPSFSGHRAKQGAPHGNTSSRPAGRGPTAARALARSRASGGPGDAVSPQGRGTRRPKPGLCRAGGHTDCAPTPASSGPGPTRRGGRPGTLQVRSPPSVRTSAATFAAPQPQPATSGLDKVTCCLAFPAHCTRVSLRCHCHEVPKLFANVTDDTSE